MGSIKRIQLEINGTCPRDCATCLPKSLKTGVMIDKDELQQKAVEWRDAGIEAITLAGYGSSVDHPYFRGLLLFLKEVVHFRVSVVCRPEEFPRCLDADQVIVSVQTPFGAMRLSKTLYATAPQHVVKICVSTHTVTSPDLSNDLAETLALLVKSPYIGRVNIADAIALCRDPEHLKAIRSCAEHRPEILAITEKARRELPQGDKITQQLEGHFPEKCAFHDDLIYVDASLDVKMCCHHPAMYPIGNLRTEKFSEVMESVKMYQDSWRQNLACQRCPDIGGKEA